MEGFCVFLQVVVTSWSDIFGDKDYLDDFQKLPRITHLTKTLFFNSNDDFPVFGAEGRHSLTLFVLLHSYLGSYSPTGPMSKSSWVRVNQISIMKCLCLISAYCSLVIWVCHGLRDEGRYTHWLSKSGNGLCR